MLGPLLEGLLLGGAAAAQPGPFQALLVQQTVARGARRTLPSAAAPLLGDGPVVVLVLGVLRSVPDGAMRSLGVAGGLYLLVLAALGARLPRATEPPARPHRGLLQAVFVNVLGPGPYLFWGLVAGPILLATARASWLAAGAFVVSFYAAMIGVNALVVLAVGWARARGERARRALHVGSVVALAGFGVFAVARGLAGR